MCEPLERARELFEKIDFSKFGFLPEPEFYTLADGMVHAERIYGNDLVEIHSYIMDAGSEIETHQHDQTEHILIYEGDATVKISGIKTILQFTQSIAIPPMTLHSLSSRGGARLLIARMPPTEGLSHNG